MVSISEGETGTETVWSTGGELSSSGSASRARVSSSATALKVAAAPLLEERERGAILLGRSDENDKEGENEEEGASISLRAR